MLNAIFNSPGIHIKLAKNGTTKFTDFCVQPRWSNKDFLHSASQRLKMLPKAIVAFDENGDMIEINEIQDNCVVIVSSTEKFIRPHDKGAAAKKGVGQYFVGPRIGRGGFGEVLLGTHKVTNEKIALKFIPIATLENVTAAERVATEVQALTAMRHPNIIKLMDVIHSMSHIVLAFEYANGGDLLHYLTQLPGCRCGVEETKEFFNQILSGVSYAHAHNICHRDLKLANLLICNGNQLKIADFGLSAFFRPGSDFKSNCGSISYLAPEVFRDSSTSGPPLDVWSLGVILFAMLCGRLPFTDISLAHGKRTDSEIIKKRILRCQYKIDGRLKPDAKDLIQSMLLLNPLERATIPEIFEHCFLQRSRIIFKKSPAKSKASLAVESEEKAACAEAAKPPSSAAKIEEGTKLQNYQIKHYNRIRGLPTTGSPSDSLPVVDHASPLMTPARTVHKMDSSNRSDTLPTASSNWTGSPLVTPTRAPLQKPDSVLPIAVSNWTGRALQTPTRTGCQKANSRTTKVTRSPPLHAINTVQIPKNTNTTARLVIKKTASDRILNRFTPL